MIRAQQLDLPVQLVNKPTLCRPYDEPTEHWVYKTDTGEPYRNPGRRPASYWYKTELTGTRQQRNENRRLDFGRAFRGFVA